VILSVCIEVGSLGICGWGHLRRACIDGRGVLGAARACGKSVVGRAVSTDVVAERGVTAAEKQ